MQRLHQHAGRNSTLSLATGPILLIRSQHPRIGPTPTFAENRDLTCSSASHWLASSCIPLHPPAAQSRPRTWCGSEQSAQSISSRDGLQRAAAAQRFGNPHETRNPVRGGHDQAAAARNAPQSTILCASGWCASCASSAVVRGDQVGPGWPLGVRSGSCCRRVGGLWLG